MDGKHDEVGNKWMMERGVKNGWETEDEEGNKWMGWGGVTIGGEGTQGNS